MLWCLYCTKLEPISKTNDSEKAPCTGEYTSNPEKKHSLHISFGKGEFLLKKERAFFFRGSISMYSGSAWGFNADSAKRKPFFSGKRIWQNLDSNFSPTEKGLVNECERDSVSDFFGGG